MVSAPILLFTGLFVLVGLGISAAGASGLRRWNTMRRMDPNSVAVESGLQEFEGHAHAVGETVTTPFTGSQSLVCEHKVERYSSSGEGSNWKTVDSGVDTVPFEIEGGGETVVVDPADANYLLTDEFQVRGREADDFPSGVMEYADETETVNAGATVELGPVELGGQRYRFTEERLDDGEEVYVLGPAEMNPRSAPGGSDARLAIAPGERGWRERFFGDPFVVSDTGEGQAIKRQLKSAAVSLLFGLLFLGGGIAVFVLA